MNNGHANAILMIVDLLRGDDRRGTLKPTPQQVTDALQLLVDGAAKKLLTGRRPDEVRQAAVRLHDLAFGRSAGLAWRDYTLEPFAEHPGVAVLCRSDDVCMEAEANEEGRYLTLGEAVDWARQHHADHVKWGVADV